MAKVLVVDDSRLTRRMLVGALQNAGHECFEADNGAVGIEAFHKHQPDCVFSDLLMPIMDGFEMTTRLLEAAPGMPIIVATADIQDSSRERCEQIGVAKLLNKPMKAYEIVAAVEQVLAASLQTVEV